MNIIFEAILVGLCVIIFGYIGSFIAKLILPVPKPNQNFNMYHIMELSLFLAGALLHLFFEFTGINKYYCVNYKKNL